MRNEEWEMRNRGVSKIARARLCAVVWICDLVYSSSKLWADTRVQMPYPILLCTLHFLNRRCSLSNALPREHQGTPLQFHCNVSCRGGACPSRNISDPCHPNAKQINHSVGYGACRRTATSPIYLIFIINWTLNGGNFMFLNKKNLDSSVGTYGCCHPRATNSAC